MAIKQKFKKKKDEEKDAKTRSKAGSKDHLKLGFIGEQVTKKHLLSKGLEFVESNFRRKYGEIDLIMKVSAGTEVAGRDREKIMFFEVKTVSREKFDRSLVGNRPDISRETCIRGSFMEGFNEHRPEDNINISKIRKIRRIIKIWLEENNVNESAEWGFNVALVYLSKTEKKFYIKILWDVIL